MLTKETLCAMLRAWIMQRPGLEFANYGNVAAYRSESRAITRDMRYALTLLGYVERMQSLTVDDMRASFRAFSGRLTLTERPDGKWVLDYCTGQYFPTEYRRAACAVLVSMIWDYWREAIPANEAEKAAFLKRHKADNPGDYLRAKGRREFGRVIGARFFN
jgi:hypothetical protein